MYMSSIAASTRPWPIVRGGDEETSVGALRVQLSTCGSERAVALDHLLLPKCGGRWGEASQGETRASQHPGRGEGWASMPARARAEQRRRARVPKWSNPGIHALIL